MSLIQTDIQALVERLRNDPPALAACRVGFQHMDAGKRQEQAGDLNAALDQYLKARAIFKTIPDARVPLADASARIASTYGNLQRPSEGVPFAEEVVTIARTVPRLEYFTATARTLLGVAHTLGGRAAEGAAEFAGAREILARLPDSATTLRQLEQTEASVAGAASSKPVVRDVPAPPLMKIAATVVVLILAAFALRGCWP